VSVSRCLLAVTVRRSGSAGVEMPYLTCGAAVGPLAAPKSRGTRVHPKSARSAHLTADDARQMNTAIAIWKTSV
jgi:hypothetical protein